MKAKTEASKLHRDLQAAEDPPVPWQRRQQEAASRVTAARRAVERYTTDSIEDLILELKPDRDAKDALIIETLNEIDAVLVDRLKFAQHVAKLLAPVPGLDAISEIPSADDITELRKTIRQFLAAGLRPTLPVSICPPEGKTPPRVKTDDGWVGVQHANVKQEREAKRGKEEVRERGARRRIAPRPPQPEPASRVLGDMIRRGWR